MMRKRTLAGLLTVLVMTLMVSMAAAAGAAADGQSKGKHAGQTKNPHAAPTTSSHDPSNPDGTYRGKSTSTPDQDGIGADHGLVNNDKVGPGTDGNNGCGNDADREDDDNGWCGNKPKPTPTSTPSVGPTATPTVAPTSGGTETEVLGETFTKSPQVLGRTLARTGIEIGLFVLASLGLLSFGYAIRALARPRKSGV